MQQKEVLELIQAIVRPLRDRLTVLEDDHHQIRTRIAGITPQIHTNQTYLRQRSKSKQSLNTPNNHQGTEPRPPSASKRDQKEEKPTWNGKAAKPDFVYVRSPTAKEKTAPVLFPPKPAGKPTSRDKLDSEKNIPTPTKKSTSKANGPHHEHPISAANSSESEDSKRSGHTEQQREA